MSRRLKIGTRIRLLLLIHLFISSFFYLQFSTLKFFVTHFLGTIRPRRLKLGTHMDSGQMYHVYQNQAAALIYPFISSFFSLSNFQNWNFWSHFSWELLGPRRLKLGTLVDSGQMYHVYQIQAAALIHPLFLPFSFSPIFKHLKFLSHFSQELWGLEDWNLVQMWIVGWCIVFTGIRLLLLIHPIISSFFFLSNYQTIKIFVTFFSRTVRSRRLKLGTHVDSGQMYCVYRPESGCCLFVPLFFHFSFSPIFKH